MGKVRNLCRVYESIRISKSTVLEIVHTRSHYLVFVDLEDKPVIINLLRNVLLSECGNLDNCEQSPCCSDMIMR